MIAATSDVTALRNLRSVGYPTRPHTDRPVIGLPPFIPHLHGNPGDRRPYERRNAPLPGLPLKIPTVWNTSTFV